MPSLNQQGREPSAGEVVAALQAFRIALAFAGDEGLSGVSRMVDEGSLRFATDHGEPAQEEGRG